MFCNSSGLEKTESQDKIHPAEGAARGGPERLSKQQEGGKAWIYFDVFARPKFLKGSTEKFRRGKSRYEEQG